MICLSLAVLPRLHCCCAFSFVMTMLIHALGFCFWHEMKHLHMHKGMVVSLIRNRIQSLSSHFLGWLESVISIRPFDMGTHCFNTSMIVCLNRMIIFCCAYTLSCLLSYLWTYSWYKTDVDAFVSAFWCPNIFLSIPLLVSFCSKLEASVMNTFYDDQAI